MDNLYNLVNFSKSCFIHPLKIHAHGAIRKGVHGFPPVVKQEEVKTRKGQAHVRGNLKSSVLKDEPGCPNIIFLSVYDTKPVISYRHQLRE